MNDNSLLIFKKIKIKKEKSFFNKQKIYKLYSKINIFAVPFLILYIIFITFKNKKIESEEKKHKNSLNIRVCLCTLGKNENKYIKEFVEYYQKYGIDKIILYDNNDMTGENFEEIIGDYIIQGFVEIKNWRGIEKAQFKIMNDCYRNNYDIFDWLIFYDIDEFIYLKNYNNIKLFLNQQKFYNCGKIELNWIHRINENLIYYEDKPLFERFPDKESNINNSNYFPQIKSILRGHIPNIHIDCLHKLTSKVNGCDGFGRRSKIKGIQNMNPDYENYYINHYFGKSLEEFIEKSKRGSAAIGKNNISIMAKINIYFEIYKITKEKIEFIEKKTGMNLSLQRKKIHM